MTSGNFFKLIFLMFFIVFLSVFSGCKEEDDSESYYVKFNLNKTDYEFTSGISSDNEGNTYSGEACGFRTIDINDDKEDPVIFIIAGAEPFALADFKSIASTCTLAINDTDGIYSGGQPSRIRINGVTVWSCDYDTEYTVTKIGDLDGVISGTFSGIDYSGDKITNGEFRVKRLRDNIIEF